jgi:protein-L-isoaspartate O-methyltransferase
MNQKFNQIKQRYEQFHKELLEKGRFMFKNTQKGYWGISVLDDVFELFKRLKLEDYRNFLDIGSGDGRVAFTASLFTNATGIEFDKELYGQSVKLMDELKIKTSILNKDFLEHDLSRYDIIYCFPDQPISREIEPKLLKELKGKLIVYGPHFHPEQLKKLETLEVNGTHVTIYTIPK